MSLLARSGGVSNEFTFTGGVAKNQAAVRALRELSAENHGEMQINISPDSIYTGALFLDPECLAVLDVGALHARAIGAAIWGAFRAERLGLARPAWSA